ncbi:MAG: phage major capsid protein [Fibrobacter sp.]|nr:phage major capsid protein [Fibrobacter sp.]
METLQNKIDLREKSIKEMRAIHEAAKDEAGEARALTGEEKAKFDKYAEEVRQLGIEIDAEKRENILGGFSTSAPVADVAQKSDETRAFEDYLRTGEKRNLVIDGEGSTAGAIAPHQFMNELIKDIEKSTPLFNSVRKIMLSKVQALDIPYETEMSDAGWLAETAEVTADTTQAFSTKAVGCDRLAKLVKVSEKAVLSSAFDLSALVRNELAYKLRCALENGILNGTGTGMPLGVFTADAKGVTTARDIQTAATGIIDADTIIKAKRKVASEYRAGGVWVMHPDMVAQVLTLKDNNGQYLWRSGLQPADPDILDGSPIIESDFAPNTTGTGNYMAVFGNFNEYWMTMLENIQVKVLQEKYAEFGLIGYTGTIFAGGLPVREKAFARIKSK